MTCKACIRNREDQERWFNSDDDADTQPPRTFHCTQCDKHLERHTGEDDISCPRCLTEHNAFGQALRVGWRDNPSTWDDDVNDLEGFEQAETGREARTGRS